MSKTKMCPVGALTRQMTYRHAASQPVYAPNSHGGPQADPLRAVDLGWTVASGELGRYAYEKHAEDDDFGQAGSLYRDVMDDTDREHLVTNIVGHAGDRVTDEVQLRVIAYWASIDPHLGARVAAGLGKANGNSSDGPTSAQAAELVAARANHAERIRAHIRHVEKRPLSTRTSPCPKKHACFVTVSPGWAPDSHVDPAIRLPIKENGGSSFVRFWDGGPLRVPREALARA